MVSYCCFPYGANQGFCARSSLQYALGNKITSGQLPTCDFADYGSEETDEADS